MTYYILNEDGETLDVTTDYLKWKKWSDTYPRRIGYDEIGIYVVSTIFVGMTKPELIIWETIIATPARVKVEGRRSTRKEAIELHEKTVLTLKCDIKN
jgi:hypothetical protein